MITRLTYNVHTWSKFAGKPRTILDSMYMRLWRRIIGDPKLHKTKMSDKQVRVALDVPSIDCCIRRRRLYFARLARAQCDALCALLQNRGKHGENMPWVEVVINDLQILRASTNGKLIELPNPAESLLPYWTLAREFPDQWNSIVALYSTHDDDVAQSSASVHEAGQIHEMSLNNFRCDRCGHTWESRRKLSVHKWSKHGVRSDIRQFVGDISVCPICGTNFLSRARLIKHLLERRVRSKFRKVSCQQAFLDLSPSVVPSEILKGLELSDSKLANSARREGHTSIIDDIPCTRTKPSVLKRARLEEAFTQHRKRRRLRQKTHPSNTVYTGP